MRIDSVLLSVSFTAATAPGALSLKHHSLDEGDFVPGTHVMTLKPALTRSEVKGHFNCVTEIHERSLNRRNALGNQSTYSSGNF